MGLRSKTLVRERYSSSFAEWTMARARCFAEGSRNVIRGKSSFQRRATYLRIADGNTIHRQPDIVRTVVVRWTLDSEIEFDSLVKYFPLILLFIVADDTARRRG